MSKQNNKHEIKEKERR